MKRYEEVSVACERFSEEDVIATSGHETDTPLQPIDPDEDNY